MKSYSTYTLLVLGGSSTIATSYARQRLKTFQDKGLKLKIVLAGRTLKKLEAEAKDLAVRGAEVNYIASDLSLIDFESVLMDHSYNIDEVILAYGLLTDNNVAQKDMSYLNKHLNTNFISVAKWLEVLTQKFTQQGHGNAIIIGSVAGDRGRQSNYIYGAAKAGLATFVAGLQHRFSDYDKIHIMLVKPGFVESSMTAHLSPKGVLWTKPDNVAKIIEKALLNKRLTVYAPFFWYFIMKILCSLPAFIFHKTKL